MRFEWDEEKSHRNVEERGLPFSLAEFLFQGRTIEAPDERRDYGETRTIAYGEITGRVMVCVYTDRVTDGEPVRRIISLRKVSSREADWYHERTEKEDSG